MITISSWPNTPTTNQYLNLYHEALGRYGIALGPPLEIQDDFLTARRGNVQAIHLQWVPEQIWRARGPSWHHRLRGVGGLWKFLRHARGLGIRILWTLHDIEPHERGGVFDGLGYRLLARFADVCICHDRWAAEQFVRRLGGRAEKVILMPHGNYDGIYPSPAPREATLTRLGLDPRRKTLVCQGMIRPYKRFDLAVDALRRLGDAYQLVVAGWPTEAAWGEDLRRRAEGLSGVRLLFEELSEQALADVVHAADCVLLPYQKITGSGAFLTVATLGRGVVASDLRFFRHLLEFDPEAGVLFPAGDVAGLAGAVRRFFERDPAERGRAARRIADRFAWSEVVKPVVAWFHRTFPEREVGTRSGDVLQEPCGAREGTSQREASPV
jgi:glycosyltransferase involved in cell wall biosynthesis